MSEVIKALKQDPLWSGLYLNGKNAQEKLNIVSAYMKEKNIKARIFSKERQNICKEVWEALPMLSRLPQSGWGCFLRE